jgi:DNA-binding MarR family transcriptional regulator
MTRGKAQDRALSPCHCTTLRKASRHISQLYDDAIAETGLKTTQRSILNQIGRSEPVTVRGLADAMVMDASALAHNLKPLERDGLLAISVDPEDRRSRRIVLTELGRSKLRDSEANWAAAQKGFEAAVGQVESRSLREALLYLTSEAFTANFMKEQMAFRSKG